MSYSKVKAIKAGRHCGPGCKCTTCTNQAVESAEEDTDENGNESDISDEGDEVQSDMDICYMTEEEELEMDKDFLQCLIGSPLLDEAEYFIQ